MEQPRSDDQPDPGSSSPDRSWLKTFIPFILVESFSVVGSTVVQFAIVWWLTETTGSSIALANGSIFIIAPGAIFGPFLATLVDRIDRRLVLIISDALISLGTIFLIIMFWLETIQLWHIFLVFGISSIFGNLQWAATNAVSSTIIPPDQLQRAEGITMTVQFIFTTMGPVLGAALTSLLPIYAVLSVDIITAAIAIVILLILKLPQIDFTHSEPITPANMWRDYKEGFRFLNHNRAFLYWVIVYSLNTFFNQPLWTFLPLLVTGYFGKGVIQVGMVDTACGIGLILGGIIMGAWGGFKRKMNTHILGDVLFGLFFILIALAPPDKFWLAPLGIFLVAINGPIGTGAGMAILKSKVPTEIQGRVFSLVQGLTNLTIPLSLAIAGPVAEKTGVHFYYWIGSIGLVVTALSRFLKPIYTIEDYEYSVHSSKVLAQTPAE